MSRFMRASAVLALVVGLASTAVADQNFNGSQTFPFGNDTIGGEIILDVNVGQTPVLLTADAGITADLTLLGNSFEALNIEASSTINDGIVEENSVVVEVAGYTVFEWTEAFEWSWDWEYVLPLLNMDEVYMIGPVPVTITVESEVGIAAELNVGVAAAGAGLGGHVQTWGFADAFAGVDLAIAWVGLTGDLDFFNGTLDANATVSWIGAEALVTYTFQVVSLILSLEVGVDLGFWDDSWDWELVNFTWGDFSGTLLDISVNWWAEDAGSTDPVDTEGGSSWNSGTPSLPDAPIYPIDDDGATTPVAPTTPGTPSTPSTPATPNAGNGIAGPGFSLASANANAEAVSNVPASAGASSVFGPVLGPVGN